MTEAMAEGRDEGDEETNGGTKEVTLREEDVTAARESEVDWMSE
jgi:hypothetical protein